jgi:hypothetical protein
MNADQASWIGDRWLISDFYLQLEAFWLQSAYEGRKSEREASGKSPSTEDIQTRLAEIDALLAGALQPTFVVAFPWVCNNRPDPVTAGVFPVPVLYPESQDFEGFVGEVVATCAATRS